IKQIQYFYTVGAAAANGATVDTTVTLISADQTLINTGDDSVTVSTTVQRQFGLQLNVAESADPVLAGNNLVYTVTVHNTGPSNAGSVTLNLSNVLPAGVSFVSASGNGSTSFDGSATAAWNVGTIAAGATATLQVTNAIAPTAAAGT